MSKQPTDLARVVADYLSADAALHGATTRNGRPYRVDPGKVRAALDTAEDRGPDGAGFYVMGEHTSRSWHPTRGEAEAEARAIKSRGAWSGTPPRVETAARRDG